MIPGSTSTGIGGGVNGPMGRRMVGGWVLLASGCAGRGSLSNGRGALFFGGGGGGARRASCFRRLTWSDRCRTDPTFGGRGGGGGAAVFGGEGCSTLAVLAAPASYS